MNRADEIIRLIADPSDRPAVRIEPDPELGKIEHRRERIRAAGARIPPRYTGLDFEEAAKRAPAIGRHSWDVDGGDLSGSLTICGSTGVGKTTLACTVLRHILAKAWAGDESSWRLGRSAWFWVAADLGREVAQCAPWETGRAADLALSASWLCIDDLGTEQGDRAISEISRIVSARYNEEQVTVITTAMSWPQLSSRYGEGIVRRMLESTAATVIELGGAS